MLSRKRHPGSLCLHPMPLVFALAFVLRAAPNVYIECREPGWQVHRYEFNRERVLESLSVRISRL